jgi:hypothetical protein
MRTFLVLLALVFLLGSVGCASSGSSGYRNSLKVTRATLRQDQEYIALVERAAARRGVAVEWVNPPFTRTENR